MMSVKNLIEGEVFEHIRHGALFEQLEKLKSPRLLETIRYVLKITGNMKADAFRFTVRAYRINVEQLLSENYLYSPKLSKFLDTSLLPVFTDRFAYNIFLVDNKVLSKIRTHINDIKNMMDRRAEEESLDVMLSEEEQAFLEKKCAKIDSQCWLFFRGVKLYESMKILLRALGEFEEFQEDPDSFRERHEKMYIPIEVHE